MRCCNCMRKLPVKNADYCPYCGKKTNEQNALHRLSAGTVLHDRYLVGTTLGEGGFGITYVGFDKTLEMKVAVKEYFPSGISTRINTVSNAVSVSIDKQKDVFDIGKENFLREARSVARFSKESGIVDVRDFFTENNTAYIVMEFLDGVDLNKYIRKNGVMEAKQTFEIMLPLMRTLEKMHRQNVIHRDISPDNIMRQDDGTLKLMDFGAARQFSREESNSLSVVLKPGYAPYEQYSSKGKQGPWTDVYALCATIYKCITGETPPDSLDRAIEDDLKKPSELGVSIPENLENTLLKGLAVHAQNRLQSMDELISAIEEKPAADMKSGIKEESVINAAETLKNDENETITADDVETAENLTLAADDNETDKNKTIAADDPDYDTQRTVSVDSVASAQNNANLTADEPKKGKKTSETVIGLVVLFILLCGIIGFIMSQVTSCSKEKTTAASTTESDEYNKESATATTPPLTEDLNRDLTAEIDAVSDLQKTFSVCGDRFAYIDSGGKAKLFELNETGVKRLTLSSAGNSDLSVIRCTGIGVVGIKKNGEPVFLEKSTDEFDCSSLLSSWSGLDDISITAYDFIDPSKSQTPSFIVTALGLRKDGTVISARYHSKNGLNLNDPLEVSGWTNIKSISWHWRINPIGLKKNGTLVPERTYMDDIIASLGDGDIMIKKNGTADGIGITNTSNYRYLAISNGYGLKTDGTVKKLTSSDNSKNYEVSDWSGITAIDSDHDFMVGKKSDGTFILASGNDALNRSFISIVNS